MERSPLSVLASFSVPLHLNIFGWGLAAAAAYAFVPEALASPVVGIGIAVFGFLYGVVAVVLLVVRIGAAEQARQVPQMSWAAVAMALLGAVLLLAVAIQVGGATARGFALAVPVVGVLCGLLGVRAVRRGA